jgi:hypothetical protein
VQTPERFVSLALAEVPEHFPQAVWTHPTKQRRSARFEQLREIASQPPEILDAVQYAKVREGSLEQFLRQQSGDVFSAKHKRLHKLLQAVFLNSARCHSNHLRRNVAGNDSHAAFCQETRVYASPASDFKRTVSCTKYSRHLAPHGCPLRSTDSGGSEGLVVSGCDRIKWCGIELLCDGHFFNTQLRSE